ncbi:hypothetical protein RHGRI_031415 [Rhododendron griersonianum]|uniref:Uncharacterized protein n=1 Tax=Rhododendron griersonianum TaxID=479676 RepID=A0AAV6I840_9ERIC|nr:hypothetical protein RHGRI_031415 [Rhododendron griersonianum]
MGTQRHGKRVLARTEDNTRTRHRRNLSPVGNNPITPQRRHLEGFGHEESSTRSSGSTARSRRSDVSGPSLTLGIHRPERPGARTRLDFDMNYPPLREKHVRSHLQPSGEETLGYRRADSRDVRRERDNSVVLFDPLTGEPVTYCPIDSGIARPRGYNDRPEQSRGGSTRLREHLEPIHHHQAHAHLREQDLRLLPPLDSLLRHPAPLEKAQLRWSSSGHQQPRQHHQKLCSNPGCSFQRVAAA